jgi:hypothetical protein
VVDRTGTVSEGHKELAPARRERLSHRVSLLINLVASAALYGLAYLAVIGIIRLIEKL